MPAFMSYAAGTTQHIISGTDVEISLKSYAGTSVVALILDNCTGVYLHDLDFNGCIGCILIFQCDGEIRVENNRFRDTGDYTDSGGHIGSGQSNAIQFISSFTGGGLSGIRGNIIYGGHTEDMISIYESGGLDAGNPLLIENNHLQSPLTGALSYASGSGSGIMCADGPTGASQFVVCQQNTVLDAGQCGIQNWSGSNIIITDNVIISQGKLRSNAGIYTPWTGGPFGGGYSNPVTDNEVSLNRILFDTNLNGNRVFAGGTYYPSSAETCIFDGGDSTPDPVTGLSPQTNFIQDGTLVVSDYIIDATTLVYAGAEETPPPPPDSTGAYAEAVIADSPYLYWRLGEATGADTAEDSSGNFHPGFINGTPTLEVDGLIFGDTNKAYEFTGAGQYILETESLPAGTYGNFTLECVLAPRAFGAYFGFLCGFLNDLNGDGIYLNFQWDGFNGTVGFVINADISSYDVGGVAVFAEDVPHHVALTWDGTNFVLYFDGEVDTSVDGTGATVSLADAETFWAANDVFGDQFIGVLDEVAFYETTLSPERIALHASLALTGVEPPPPPPGPVPNVTSINVHSGPTAGGTSVDITGTNFVDVIGVKFGATSSTGVDINSSTSITAVAPPHVSGVVDITVVTVNGTSGPSTADHFTFTNVPSVSDVSPNAGAVDGGEDISLSGVNFTGATSVLFGTYVASFTVNDDTSITASAPPHDNAIVNIRVVTPSGTSPTSVSNRYTYGVGGGSGGGGGGGPGGGGVVGGGGIRVAWTFVDTINGDSMDFGINPDAGGTPGLSRKTVQNRLADGDKVLNYANAPDASTVEFSGVLIDSSDYDTLVDWFNRTNPIEITDDLGRTFTVVFTRFDAKREWKATVPFYAKYTATAMVL